MAMIGSMRLFSALGHCIGRWPLAVLLGTGCLFLPLLSYFLIYPLQIETDIRRGFAHIGGRSTREFDVFGEFYNVSVENMEVFLLLVESKDQGRSRMPMSAQLLREVDQLDQHLKKISTPSSSANEISFSQLQTAKGDLNYLFHAFKWALDIQEGNIVSNRSLDSDINLTYPTAHIWGHDVPIYPHFFNVTTREKTPAMPVPGGKRAGAEADGPWPTTIESVGTIVLWYLLEVDGVKADKTKLQELELGLFETSKADNFSQLFSFHVYGDEIGNYEMTRGSGKCGKMLAVGMLLMLLFMSAALRRFGWRSQLLLVPAAIISPLFAIAITFAVLGWLGVRLNSVMSVMPFLVLGIGVDDAFLLLHSWRKWGRRTGGTSQEAMARRMASVLEETGPSISITSLTNVLAFGIGIFSPSRIMRSFCLATMVAIGFDFLFELILFTPCMALAERMMAKIQRAAHKPTDSAEVVVDGVDQSKSANENATGTKSNIEWRRYSKFIASRRGRKTCLIMLSALYIVAYFGFRQMKVTFEPQKSFPLDSALLESARALHVAYVEYTPMTFIVKHPPNISDTRESAQFNKLLDELETMPRSYERPQRTQLWLTSYLQEYSEKKGEGVVALPSYKEVPSFLSSHLLDDKNLVRFHVNPKSGEVEVDSFVFTIGYNGYTDWHERAHFLNEVRDIVDKYPRFNISVFDFDATIYDLIATVRVELAKAMLITLAAMTIACFFVIPDFRHTGIAILNVVSIFYTLLGVLGWWELDLDPVTMITLLMAVGYSVDYSAHICYHYHKLYNSSAAKGMEIIGPAMDDSPGQRARMDAGDGDRDSELMTHILKAVGRPMLEAAASTFVCMLPLFFVRIYIVYAFAKTCVTVVVLGLLHGLFVLPIILLILSPPRRKKVSLQNPESTPLKADNDNTITLVNGSLGTTEAGSRRGDAPPLLVSAETPSGNGLLRV